MLDFIRSLEESISSIMLESLTPDQARTILQSYGARREDLSPDKLRSTWIRLVQKYHPDRAGGDSQTLARINSAYDTLKNQGKPAASPSKDPASSAPKEPTSRQPAWQTDPRSAYNGWAREDYTDLNWFKKRMWELSGQSKHRYTIWAYDGRYFRGAVTVFGSREIYQHMARAMVDHTTRGGNRYPVEAVFVQDNDHPEVLMLVWLNGKDLRPPVPLEHESSNANPSNDQVFMKMLPKTLVQIETGRDRLDSFPSVAAALGRYRTS